MEHSLTIVLALIAGLAVLATALYERAAARAAARARLCVWGLTAVLVGTSVAVYASIGHPRDYQPQGIDETVDNLLPEKIAAAARAAKADPRNVALRVELASLYMGGGYFGEAVGEIDAALEMTGPDARLFGMKATAAYYRDDRVMSPEASEAARSALRLDRNEVSSRMLLAQDAFLAGRYRDAIAEWQSLIDAGASPEKAQAFRNAIANARSRMGQD